MKEILGRILGELDSSQRAAVSGLDDAAAAFLLASLARESKRSLFILSPTIPSSRRLLSDLEYFLGGIGAAASVPAYETLPFELEDPDPELSARRMASLWRMASARKGVYVSPGMILAQRLVPADVLRGATLSIDRGGRLDPLQAAKHLEALGYSRVSLVENPGEYGLRGSIMDIFSPGWLNPVRLDLMGDTVEEMKWFNPEGQRSLSRADRALVLPATEIVGTDAMEVFRRRAKALSPLYGHETYPLTLIYREMAELGVRPRHTALLPLFYQSPATIFDYCPPETIVVLVNPPEILQQARGYLAELRRRGEEEGYDIDFIDRFAAESSAALKAAERGAVRGLATLQVSPLPAADSSRQTFQVTAGSTSLRLSDDIRPRTEGWAAANRIREWTRDSRVILVCRTGGAARRLMDILREYDIGTRLAEGIPFDPAWPADGDRSILVHVGELKDGFRLPEQGITFVTEDDLFGPRRRPAERRAARATIFELDFSTLKTGDYLVHEEHGIATYGGLTRIRVNSNEEEMLTLLYADGGLLYVPMDRLSLVQKYIYAEGHTPRVDRLGGTMWRQTKTRARRAARTMVRDMIRTQARRSLLGGHAFGPDTPWQKEFEALFEYEETPDQWRSIEEVKRDMEGEKPMDRLVCGDVGYGKTEVALRAAFKAASNGKQVAMLAPTTVLCHQHHLTFRRRFAPFPLRVEALSRFSSSADQKKVVQGLADGTVDVVIGTHRLLQADIRFRDLGLLITDEEHRFGVKDKERLKAFRESVDVLTLSATPIPRTFYMAMSGLRDLSIIETPPESRLGVKTRVLPFSGKIIREAIMREMSRGGQTFFLHNRIKSIFSMSRFLASLVPEARIGTAHGQMAEKSLKKVMDVFTAGGYDVLVSTSIVESGLDIPNANTMIINRADRFGLADLYQLRGRIGRSSHQAFAYLMIPAGVITESARQRLAAIEEFSDLGAGVNIAALDLEIRGAGNLLGVEQSGRMAEVGLEMYTRILEEAVAEVKGEAPPAAAAPHTEILTPWAASLPQGYLSDEQMRLTAYKRLSLVDREENLQRFVEELVDIFGHPPAEARTLFSVCSLRISARGAGVEKIAVTPGGAELVFSHATPVDPSMVLDLIRSSAGSIRLKGQDRLLVALPPLEPEEALDRVKKVLRELAGHGSVLPTVST